MKADIAFRFSTGTATSLADDAFLFHNFPPYTDIYFAAAHLEDENGVQLGAQKMDHWLAQCLCQSFTKSRVSLSDYTRLARYRPVAELSR